MTETEAVEAALGRWYRLSHTLVGDAKDVERRLVRQRASWRGMAPATWSETQGNSLEVVHTAHRDKRPVQVGTWWPELVRDFEEEIAP